ncbi:hypothetical protein GCM10027217_18610 [Pseudomaricurvus hydrocarbonicus]
MVDGVKLEENLYPDNKKRTGHYRYLKPDGTFRHFTAETVHQANSFAADANSRRAEYTAKKPTRPQMTMLESYACDFIDERQAENPGLKNKASWRNRSYALKKFGREISTPFSRLQRHHIEDWWRGLTHHQQKARHAEFRKFFNYLMGRNVLPNFEYNPFTTSDDRPRFYAKESPARSKERLTRESFWLVYDSAGELGYEALQIAMGVALTTFMRETDILTLRLDEHVEGKLLKRVIGKSAAQKGQSKAARLQWDVGNYELLRQLIKRARELSLRNQRCPYLISHMPAQRRKGKGKEHICQVLPRRLQDMWNDARDHTGYWKDLPAGKKPPTFHECRSLADKLAAEAGYDIKAIQSAMAHSDAAQSLMYLGNHDLPYEEVQVKLTADQIGRDFSK